MNELWQFVAMEYYALILNRTYLVSVSSTEVSGKVCRGITAVEGGSGLTRQITRKLAISSNLQDPRSYVSGNQLAQPHKADFCVKLGELLAVRFNPLKKWGMGPYPHDGRVILLTATKRRELIILGDQSGKDIADRIANQAGVAG